MMRPRPFPNSAAGMSAPASRALISLQSAFPIRPQVIPNRKLHWRSSSKTAGDLCVLVCTHEAGFLSRDDAAPMGLLVCQRTQRRHWFWHRHTSPPKASARRQRPTATSHRVADNSAHPIDSAVIDVIAIPVVYREQGFEQNPDHRPPDGLYSV